MLFIARTTKKQTINYHHLKLLSEKSIVNIYALGEKKTELIMKFLGWVVQMLISTNPGLKFHPIFVQMPFLDNFFIFLLEHPVLCRVYKFVRRQKWITGVIIIAWSVIKNIFLTEDAIISRELVFAIFMRSL